MSVKNNYPSYQPTIFADFAKSKSIPVNFTFRRSTNATYVDKDGLIKNARLNSPRITHDPVTKKCLGLLMEAGSDNRNPYSVITSTNGWNAQRITFTNNAAFAPDGNTVAVKLTADADGPWGHSIYRMITSGANNSVHTFSVFVKSAGYNYAACYIDTSGGYIGRTVVNLTTGEFGCFGTTGDAVLHDYGAEPYGNGWYRIWVSGRFPNTNNYYCHVDVANDAFGNGFTGDGTNGIYAWGAQLENSWITAYMPTNGSTVSKSYDECSFSIPTTEWYNNRNGDGTWIVEARSPYNAITTGTNCHLFMVAPSTDQNQAYQVRFNGYDRFNAFGSGVGGQIQSWGSYTSVTDQWVLTDSVNGYTPNERYLIALGLQTNNVSLVVNGRLIGTNTGAVLRNDIGKLQVGGTVSTSAPGQPYSGIISKLLYYPFRFTNQQLINLTNLDNN